jgi:hypothetical protein
MIERENAKVEEVQAMETEQLGSPIVHDTKANPDLVRLINDGEDNDQPETHMDYQSGKTLTDHEAKNVAVVTELGQRPTTQLNLYFFLGRKRKSFAFKKQMYC